VYYKTMYGLSKNDIIFIKFVFFLSLCKLFHHYCIWSIIQCYPHLRFLNLLILIIIYYAVIVNSYTVSEVQTHQNNSVTLHIMKYKTEWTMIFTCSRIQRLEHVIFIDLIEFNFLISSKQSISIHIK